MILLIHYIYDVKYNSILIVGDPFVHNTLRILPLDFRERNNYTYKLLNGARLS